MTSFRSFGIEGGKVSRRCPTPVPECLINPAFTPLQKIKLDPSQSIAAQQNFMPAGAFQNEQLNAQALGAGTYTIFYMDRFGDTRGQELYDESFCVGQGGAFPQSQVDMGYTIGPQ